MSSSMIADYNDLLSYMIVDLPSCPDKVILQQLRQTGRDFLARTEIWTEDLDSINVVANTADYDLSVGDNAYILRIKKAEYLGGTLAPDDFYFLNNKTFRFVTTPVASKTDALDITVILSPLLNSEIIPIWILERYAEPIMAGAKRNLLVMPNKPWSNPDLGNYFDEIYSIGISTGKRESYAGYTSGSFTIQNGGFI